MSVPTDSVLPFGIPKACAKFREDQLQSATLAVRTDTHKYECQLSPDMMHEWYR